MLPKEHLTSHSKMSVGEWPQHHGFPIIKAFSVQFFSVLLPPPINLFCFCYLFTISVHYCAHPWIKCSLYISNFLEEISGLSHCMFFFHFFGTVHLTSSCLSLLFSRMLNSHEWVFPFLPCLSRLFFPQLFLSLLRQPLCLLAFLFPWGGFILCLLYNVMNLCPSFFRHSLYQI